METPTSDSADAAPLVSVITPVLDRASSIERCLASVSAQTYPHVEHIVVDGGSTDGTLRIVEEFRSRRGLRWVSRPDRGMYEAVNRGLAMAEGSILAYLNSDDLYLPWTVAAAVEALATDRDLAYGDLGVITRNHATSFRPQFYRPFDLNHYTHREALAQPTVLWRREVTESIGPFDEGYRLVADCEYWLRAAAAGYRFRHVEEILALQTDHPGMLRATRRDEVQRELARIRSRYTPVAGPATRPLRSALEIRLGARWHRTRFWAASRSRGPRRWRRFLSFLRDHGVATSLPGLLWHLAPGRVRPPGASLVDVEALDRALDRILASASRPSED